MTRMILLAWDRLHEQFGKKLWRAGELRRTHGCAKLLLQGSVKTISECRSMWIRSKTDSKQKSRKLVELISSTTTVHNASFSFYFHCPSLPLPMSDRRRRAASTTLAHMHLLTYSIRYFRFPQPPSPACL